MFFNFPRLIFAVLLISAAIICVNAQFPDAAPNKEDYPKTVKETLAKGRIDREKKDYEQLIERGEEAAQISSEISKSFAKHNKFSSEDQKKLDRLEKLVKKIRNELGGDDDDSAEDKPSSISVAVKTLQEKTANLVDTIKKSTRYSVSVAAIESSNALLKIVRFIRFGN
ncbi:hypothetical protein BH20ACI1_BH20ACI1_03650 [soil metagenome]